VGALLLLPCVLHGQAARPTPFLSLAITNVGAKSPVFSPQAALGAQLLIGIAARPRGSFAELGAAAFGASQPFGSLKCVIDVRDFPPVCRPSQPPMYHASALVRGEMSRSRLTAALLIGPGVLSATNSVAISGTRRSVAAVHGHAEVRVRVVRALSLMFAGDALKAPDVRVGTLGLGVRVQP